MRVRNQRTGRWIELPDDDGMIRFPHTDRLFTPEQRQYASRRFMGDHDNLPAQDRWGGNMFGLKYKGPRSLKYLRAQLAKTDPQSWQEFAAAELGL